MRRIGAFAQTAVRWLVLLAIARIAAGVAIIALIDRDAVAWGYEVTLIVVAVFAACLLAALAVRRYAPPRRAS